VPPTGAALQKDAIFGRGVLDDRGSQAHTAQVLLSELRYRHLQESSDDLYLRPRDPDIPLARPRAARPAPLTLEMQPRNIPSRLFLGPGIQRRPPKGRRRTD
jgi:hypothetical protein